MRRSLYSFCRNFSRPIIFEQSLLRPIVVLVVVAGRRRRFRYEKSLSENSAGQRARQDTKGRPRASGAKRERVVRRLRACRRGRRRGTTIEGHSLLVGWVPVARQPTAASEGAVRTVRCFCGIFHAGDNPGILQNERRCRWNECLASAAKKECACRSAGRRFPRKIISPLINYSLPFHYRAALS